MRDTELIRVLKEAGWVEADVEDFAAITIDNTLREVPRQMLVPPLEPRVVSSPQDENQI